MPLPRLLARINRRVLNPREIARGERPVLTHVGRTSGRTYRTPLGAQRVGDGFVVDLLYGSESDWVRNVLAAGTAEVEVEGQHHQLVNARLVPSAEADAALGRTGRRRSKPGSEHLRLDIATG